MATTYYSAEVTLQRAGTLNAATKMGPIDSFYFSFTVPTATLAAADLLMVGIMPKGAMYLGSEWVYSAAGVAVTANVGSYTLAATPVVISAAKYGALTTVVAAGSQTIGKLPTTGYGGLETADVYIGLVTAAAIAPAAMTIAGQVFLKR